MSNWPLWLKEGGLTECGGIMPDSQKLRGGKKNGAERNSAAQDIYRVIESMGINDRDEKDELTQEVLLRLERDRVKNIVPLPGMEDLVPKPTTNPTITEIELNPSGPDKANEW